MAFEHVSNGEARAARRIVREALKAGYTLSVHDGEEWALKRSTSFTAICEALAATGVDRLVVRNPDGGLVGSMLMVWGNAPDGSELVADCTDRPEIVRLADLCQTCF